MLNYSLTLGILINAFFVLVNNIESTSAPLPCTKSSPYRERNKKEPVLSFITRHRETCRTAKVSLPYTQISLPLTQDSLPFTQVLESYTQVSLPSPKVSLSSAQVSLPFPQVRESFTQVAKMTPFNFI